MKVNTFLKATSLFALTSFLVACGNSQSSGKAEVEFFSQKQEMQTTLQEIVDDYKSRKTRLRLS